MRRPRLQVTERILSAPAEQKQLVVEKMARGAATFMKLSRNPLATDELFATNFSRALHACLDVKEGEVRCPQCFFPQVPNGLRDDGLCHQCREEMA
jgi:hypothetical protein